ncbi:MAG: nucleotidyltransferase family protein [Muribaculaceae bacterium]
MKALIFAAGLGTRLKPLTNTMPKALVPLCGVPMLQRVINNIMQIGITDIVINIHHFGEQIVQFIEENHNFGANITISDERDLLLDTGGGIVKAQHLLDGDEPFLVHNADIFTDLNLQSIINHHKASNAHVTLLVKQRNTQRYLVFDNDNRMMGWTNVDTGEVKPASLNLQCPHQCFAFGGVHVISPEILPLLSKFSAEPKFSIIPFYINACSKLNIQAFNPQGYHWFDIGKLETLHQAESYLQAGE